MKKLITSAFDFIMQPHSGRDSVAFWVKALVVIIGLVTALSTVVAIIVGISR